MTEKELRFTCAYRTRETTVALAISNSQQKHRKGVNAVFYCEHCEKPHKIEVPDHLNVDRFIWAETGDF